METKRQIEILNNIITELYKAQYIYGLCGILSIMLFNKEISEEEFFFTQKLLEENKPTPYNQFSEFCINKYWVVNYDSVYHGYWWLPMYHNKDTRKVRIEFMTKLIETIK